MAPALASRASSGRPWSGREHGFIAAYIGPFTSVGQDCSIVDSEIEYSIILGGASVRGVGRIESSLIGHNVEVTPAPRVPRAHRLVLGDESKVQIRS